jgi:Nif-specific regulatory protein
MDETNARQKYERKIKELSLLFDISQLLDKSMDLRNAIQPVLKSMAEHMGMLRGTITLVNRGTQDIYIEAAYGLSKTQLEKGIYKLGEGVTGRVIQTGTPAVVPKISDEPQFLNKTGARADVEKADISFICVPIKALDGTIGSLSADRLFDDSIDLNEDLRLLTIIASMISRAMQLRQEANAEKSKLMDENQRLQEELKERFHPHNIIGNSKEMQKVYDLIAQVTRSEATVLIQGESGTGKELIAHAIHYNSQRAKFPFIKVNCAALPESIIESELFGHEKGSFTGALAARKGRFELANNGTIFLDEIGDISPLIQVKLLRVLQEREFERVGGTDTVKVNVRVITATNKDLEKLVESEKFRTDLFYRLNVFPIHVPSLKERKADIILLADHFVKKYGKQNSKEIKRISTGAIDMLMSYHWPGNVRELENCVERAVILSTDDVIHGHHLPPSLQTAEASGTKYSGSLEGAIDNFEREMVIEALKSSRGNMAKASKALGITERQMGLRVEKYGIEYKRFRT